jgi:MoaA/NifB/PqqE/SkfB family radical SAM enzyme
LYIPKSPIMLCIGLTTKCNLNCRHCSADANSENVFFPHSELITIIDTAKELGVKKLILFPMISLKRYSKKAAPHGNPRHPQ